MVGPEFEAASWLAHNLSLPLRFGRVDVDKHADLTRRFDVDTFPTFFLFRDGTPEGFPMLTTGEAYVAGAAKMLGLEGVDIAPAKMFDGPGAAVSEAAAAWLFWRGANEGKIATTMVLFHPHGLAGEAAAGAAAAAAAFDAASRELLRNPNFRFAIIRGPAVFEDFEVDASRASIVLYKDHDEGRVEFTAPPDAAAIVAWAQAHAVPLVTVVTHRTLQRYRKKVGKLALLFLTEQQVEDAGTVARLSDKLLGVLQALEGAGAVRRGDFTLGLTNGVKYASWLAHYGVSSDAPLPALVLEETAREALFRGPDSFASDAACDGPALAAHQAAVAASGVVDAPRALALTLPAFCATEGEEGAVSPGGGVVMRTVNGVGTQTVGKVVNAAGWEFVLPEPDALTWVDVPAAQLQAWLQAHADGKLQPIRPPKAAAAAA
jgi:hypothetical protein